jgi:hypothetical protein
MKLTTKLVAATCIALSALVTPVLAQQGSKIGQLIFRLATRL